MSNILVSGANGNLGSAIAEKLLYEGHRVLGLIPPNTKRLSEDVDYFETDLTNESSVQACFKDIQKRYDRIDSGILTVGGFAMGNIYTSTAIDVTRMWQLNFMTTFLTSQQLIKVFAGHGGNLVFVGAKPALEGGSFEVMPYSISKGAVIQLAQTINEYTSKTKVKASVIVPSIIDTPPNRSAMPDANFEDWVTKEQIADAVYFLISEEGKQLREPIFKIYGNS